MNILIRFIIILFFIITAIFPFFLNAKSCDFPNIDECYINNRDKVFFVEEENISLKNKSNLEIGSIIFSQEKLNIDMYDSKLNLNRIIPPNSKYEVNVSLNNSYFTFRNSNSIIIEELSFTNTEADKPSIFTVYGFSNVRINNITTGEGSKSVIEIKSSSSTVSLKSAKLNELYLVNGYFRIMGGNTSIDSIFNYEYKYLTSFDNDESTNEGYKDLNKGGRIEVVDKGNLTIGKIDAAQLHVVSGNVVIKGDYNIFTVDNVLSDNSDIDKDPEDTLITIEGSGMVNTIKARDLKLLGGMTIQNSGSINNINYAKNEGGDYVGDVKGTLVFEGLKIPDKDGNIKEDDPTPELTLRSVYLDKLVIKGGKVSILSKNSEINEISDPNKKGYLRIEYVSEMKSKNVQINTLDLYSTKYYIVGDFKVDNLKMGSSAEIHFDTISRLNFESLEMGSYSKIEVKSGTLDINVSKNLSVYGTMLNVDSLFLGNKEERGTLKIGVDKNLITTASSSFINGVNSTGNIELSNVNVIADIQDTSIFNLKISYSYNVLHADREIKMTDTNVTTNLPSWFDSDYRIENNEKGENLVVSVQRNKSYNELLASSSFAEDKNTQNIAKSLDKMVEDYAFTQGLSKVITSIDLKSDIDTIGKNLSSLKPIDNNVYIHDIHANASSYLDMVLQNSSYSYLKTKDNKGDILWIRNGFKKGKLNSKNFYDGNRYNIYFAMAGFDIFAVDTEQSYFQLGVAGGFNFSDIKAKSYNINSVGYNVALYSSYVSDYFILNINFMYLNTIYDTERYNISDGKVTSSNNTSEFLSNIEIGSNITLLNKISYDNTALRILGINNLLFKPTLFYSNGYIRGNKVTERGIAGFNLDSYNTTIHDTGFGALFYSTSEAISTDNKILKGYYMPFVEIKTFYRIYSVPDTKVGFIDMGSYYDIDIYGGNSDGFVTKLSLGLDYEKEAHVLGIKYSYEHGISSYNDHAFYLNYKFLLN